MVGHGLLNCLAVRDLLRSDGWAFRSAQDRRQDGGEHKKGTRERRQGHTKDRHGARAWGRGRSSGSRRRWRRRQPRRSSTPPLANNLAAGTTADAGCVRARQKGRDVAARRAACASRTQRRPADRAGQRRLSPPAPGTTPTGRSRVRRGCLAAEKNRKSVCYFGAGRSLGYTCFGTPAALAVCAERHIKSMAHAVNLSAA